MLVFLLACVVSFVPFAALYLWLRNRRKGDIAYKTLCNKALGRGALCVLPVMLFSGVSYIALRLTGLHNTDKLLYQALYNFIVLALMEELAKYLGFRHVLKKSSYPFSWLDMTVLMTIIGIGFGAIESVIYAIGAIIPVVLVRGICMPHAGYGFLVGYFYGKSVRTGKPALKGLGFILSWFIHGLYDFSLSEEFVAINDNLVIVALLLALLDIVLVFRLIRFVKKAARNETYTQPLLPRREV